MKIVYYKHKECGGMYLPTALQLLTCDRCGKKEYEPTRSVEPERIEVEVIEI
jgi:hypothetical protein